jgi:PIN domain nuclease of toxin-antitoxin system
MKRTTVNAAAIPAALRERLGSRRDTFVISAASAWEIAIKASLGRLRRPAEPSTFLCAAVRGVPVGELPIAHARAARVAEPPLLHSDPFDRTTIAQAQIEGLAIMTVDRAFRAYGVPLISS